MVLQATKITCQSAVIPNTLNEHCERLENKDNAAIQSESDVTQTEAGEAILADHESMTSELFTVFCFRVTELFINKSYKSYITCKYFIS